MNEILAHLNRSADAAGGAGKAAGTGGVVGAAGSELAESLFSALDRLRDLLGVGGAPSSQERRGIGDCAELERAIHLVLQRPDHKLVAYGTLVPGGANHGRVAALRGAWQRCFVRGRRWTAADGDPAFRWNPGEPEVAAMLLVSDQLPSAWPALDRFEGSPYRRRLVPVRVEEAHHVAYIYESLDRAILE